MTKQTGQALKEAGSIIIFPHIMPDGDTIGSSAALHKSLLKAGKKSLIYLEDDIPEQYKFLLSPEDVFMFSEDTQPPWVPDAAVAVDSSDIERLGKRGAFFMRAPMTLCIDHHKSNNSFAKINLIDPSRAATAELIYELIIYMQGTPDRETATCIYIGLLTDTGCFRFSNTTPQSHIIAAELIRTGIDVSELTMKIFDEMPLRKLKLIGCAIDSLELFLDGKLAVMSVTEEDVKQTGALQEDFNDIVNFARNLAGVDAALLLRQNGEGVIKASMRTTEKIDAAELAAIFGGGGHSRAAGFNYNGSFGELKKRLAEEVGRSLWTE